MPNIILPDGAVMYREMTDSVWAVLADISIDSDDAMIFNGKKLSLTAEFSSVPHLTDKSNVYVIRKIPELVPVVTASDVNKCHAVYNSLNESELRAVQDEMESRQLLRNALRDYAALRTDNEGLNLLNNFALLTETIFDKERSFKQYSYLIIILRKVMAKVVAERDKIGLLPSTSMASNNVALAPNPQAAPITPSMLQEALNLIGLPATSSISSVPPGRANTGSTPPPAPMEVEPNYAQLREMYGDQLARMREFGFLDDETNLRMLQACEGNVEGALELVITLQENEQQSGNP